MEQIFAKQVLTSLSKVQCEIKELGLAASKEVFNEPVNLPNDSLTIEETSSILFFAAEPTDTARLRVGEELREIEDKLRLGRLRSFKLHQRFSVRPEDLSQSLLDVCPRIVHFSGHGNSSGELCIENKQGEVHPIQPSALAALFNQFSSHVRCVLLNACFSQVQASAIAEHIPYVIGMNHAIQDRGAIAFSIGFYQALGAGCTIYESYKLGCIQIALNGIPDHLVPQLIHNGKAV